MRLQLTHHDPDSLLGSSLGRVVLTIYFHLLVVYQHPSLLPFISIGLIMVLWESSVKLLHTKIEEGYYKIRITNPCSVQSSHHNCQSESVVCFGNVFLL